MRIGLLLALLAVGCSPGVAIGRPCDDVRRCPSGYACGGALGCYAPCTGFDLDDCDWLETGEGVAFCSAGGVCRIRCFTDGDCPAPLHCEDSAGGECIR